MKQMERKRKLPHGGGSDGGLIGPRNAVQSKNFESRRNPPVTSLHDPVKECRSV